jgi:hypothetical protein
VTLADVVAARIPGHEDGEHCAAHKQFADVGVSTPAE